MTERDANNAALTLPEIIEGLESINGTDRTFTVSNDNGLARVEIAWTDFDGNRFSCEQMTTD